METTTNTKVCSPGHRDVPVPELTHRRRCLPVPSQWNFVRLDFDRELFYTSGFIGINNAHVVCRMHLYEHDRTLECVCMCVGTYAGGQAVRSGGM